MADGEDDRIDLVVAKSGGLLGGLQLGSEREVVGGPAHLVHHDLEGRAGAGSGIAEIDALALQVIEGLDAGIGTRNHGEGLRMHGKHRAQLFELAVRERVRRRAVVGVILPVRLGDAHVEIAGTDAVDVIVNALPIVDAGSDIAFCYGGSIILNGSGADSYAWDNGVTDATAFTPTATATYTVTGTDTNGCVATDAVDVTVNALPNVDAGGGPTLVWGPTDVNDNTETISLSSNELYELYINHSDVNPDGFGSIKFSYTDGTVDEFKFWGNGGMRLWDPLTASYGNNYTVGIHSSAFMSEANTSKQYYVECSSVTGVNTWTFRNLDTGLSSIELTDSASWQGLLGSQISLISSQNYTICEGDSVTLSGGGALTYAWDNGVTDAIAFTPTATATYTVTGTDANGCVGTDAVDVTVNAIYNNTVTLSVCYGDSALINGNYELASGSFYDTATSVLGCDSITITNFTVENLITNSVVASVCFGDSLFVGGAYQSAAGNYVDSFSSASGCDSLVTTTLTVTTAPSSTDIQQAACDFTWIDGVTYTASNSTATFTISNALGCDSVVTLDLTIDPIVASIAQNGNDIEATATNGAAPYSYDWSTGETTASITPAANGPYWVVVSDVDDCFSDTTSFDVTFVSGTGILNLDNVFNIYPNPTSDIINIDAKGNNQYLSATVYDIFGKLLINTKSTKISLNKFEDGVYILEINTPKNTYTTRIIKH